MSRKSLIIIAVVAVAGMAAILWFVRRSERADHFTPAMEHLSSVGSFSAGVAVDTLFESASADGEGSETMPLRISGTSQVGRSSGGALVAKADLSVDVGDPASRLMNLSALLADDGMVYSMVDGLPADLADVIDVDALNGVWFSLGEDALAMLLPWTGSVGVEGTEVKEAREGTEARPFDFAQGREGTEGAWLLPGRRFDDTIMEGVPVAHYEALIDKGVLTARLADLTGSLRGQVCTAEDRVAIADYVAGRDFLTEAWIDKGRDRFYLIKVIAVPTADDSDDHPVAVTVKFIGFGVPVEAEPPEGARPLTSVLMKLLRVPAADVGSGQ